MSVSNKKNSIPNVNNDVLSENNKQLYDLCCFITNQLYIEITNNNLSKTEMYSKIFNDTIKRYKLISKKRNRRVINKDNMCMGRKLDSLQCTRKRRPGHEYCLSHLKNTSNGRIDQDPIVKKSVGKRGRKRKNNYDPKQNDNNYITMWEVLIENEKYFCDNDNNIYTFDEIKPKFLGKMTIDCIIDKTQKPKIDFSNVTKSETISTPTTPSSPVSIDLSV
jgi:hypothetical protein